MTEPDELQTIPGIGPKISKKLRNIGYSTVGSLANADPEKMYDELCNLEGKQFDRCVLYTFRCAVYYASHRNHEPELLKWWNWMGDPKKEPTGHS